MRLNERKLDSIINNLICEVIKKNTTINLQLINGYFYPVDAISSDTLEKELNLGRIPERRLDIISPKLVKLGYKLSIKDYDPRKYYVTNDTPFRGSRFTKSYTIENPCVKCNLNGMCDSDNCGKQHFRLFSK